MADEPQGSAPDTAEDEADLKRRSYLGVIVAVIVIALAVLIVLLLLRGCGSGEESSAGKNGDKTIVPVTGLSPAKGAVSVWVDEGTSIDTVLTAAEVKSADVVNMGGGRYVIAVPEGTEASAAARLLKIDGVIDTGLVYANEAAE